MILVGDSGSTKTDWRLISAKGELTQLSCKGLNPHFHSIESIKSELASIFSKPDADKIEQVFFYGSGCSGEANKKLIFDALNAVFKNSDNHPDHDLLGAARASCGREAGLAGIIGTGSNCCFFDGDIVQKEFRSGGFILGDEGGGVDLGRSLLKAYVEQYLPEHLNVKFEKRFKTSYDEILEALYKKPFPNRFIARFSQFVFQNREDLFIQDIIVKSFSRYIENQVLKYDEAKSHRLNLVGSIAFYYHDIFKAVANKYGIVVGTILEKPISGLALYHSPLNK